MVWAAWGSGELPITGGSKQQWEAACQGLQQGLVRHKAEARAPSSPRGALLPWMIGCWLRKVRGLGKIEFCFLLS